MQNHENYLIFNHFLCILIRWIHGLDFSLADLGEGPLRQPLTEPLLLAEVSHRSSCHLQNAGLNYNPPLGTDPTEYDVSAYLCAFCQYPVIRGKSQS